MREINILGINLQDYTLREKLRLTDGYLKNGALNTIECVSAKTLMAAGDNEEQRQWLEAMDMVVYCDMDIARSAGITARSRLKEIESNSYMKELLKKIARERRSIYLLSDSEAAMEMLEADLGKVRETLRIAGRNILLPMEAEGSAVDGLINDINDKAPGVVMALFTYPVQEKFIFDNKNRMNANIWVGLQKDSLILGMEEKGLRALLRKMQRKLFQRKVLRYENQEKPEQ